ncbi:BnaAnng30520D [Brassica napus]|uniref:(rape) hypothetical protein n=1 Tax=Brassica napus TaxID=3708 RepID=A0A078JPG5_BRANA|nr:unnamed protein product [Brassica napus]CDY69468.1 BnaAnng30520D [Brassica napus]
MYLNSINDGSNSANFGSSVFDGYGHVVVLVSLIVTSNVRSSLTSQHFIGLLEPLVVAVSGSNNYLIWMLCVNCVAAVAVVRLGMCFEAFNELFSGGSLSLRADDRRDQNYWVPTLG